MLTRDLTVLAGMSGCATLFARPLGVFAILSGLIAASSLSRAEERNADEYQLSAALHHEIAGRLTGFGEAEYHDSPDLDSQTTVICWPGLTYTASTWLQFAGGLRSALTENAVAADTLELRPFAGVKVQGQTRFKWHFYNYTRYEYRHVENQDTHANTVYGRIRSRFAVEFPLCSAERAWKTKTWYGFADVEPYYRLDTGTLDPVLLRGGIGYIPSSRFHLELIYQAQLARPAGGGSREVTSNIIQLNVKVGLQEGLLRRLQNMTHGRTESALVR